MTGCCGRRGSNSLYYTDIEGGFVPSLLQAVAGEGVLTVCTDTDIEGGLYPLYDRLLREKGF